MADPFASVHARHMDRGDLGVMAEHLRDLIEHPAWAFVQQLLTDKAEHLQRTAHSDPARVAKAIVKDPAEAAAHFAEIAGRVRGMGTAREIVHSVIKVADEQAADLERATHGV